MRINAARQIALPPVPDKLPQEVREYAEKLHDSIKKHLRQIYDSLVTTDLELASDAAIYLGNFDTNGSWRFVRSGNDLVIQRLEAGTWTTKSTIAA
jgi:hypothetical protein